MLSYGLKPWNDDDIQEANAILEAMMRDARREQNNNNRK